MIKLIAIGKNKDKALQSLEKEYMKRLSAFCKFSEIEVKDEANEHISREAEVLLVKEKEGNRVLEKLSDQDFVVLLDLHVCEKFGYVANEAFKYCFCDCGKSRTK